MTSVQLPAFVVIPLAPSWQQALSRVCAAGHSSVRAARNWQNAFGKSCSYRVQHNLLQHICLLCRVQVAGELREADQGVPYLVILVICDAFTI